MAVDGWCRGFPGSIHAIGASVRLGIVRQVVAVDVESRDPRPAENSCAVSASFHVDACARNTFTLEPYVPRTAKAAAMMPVYDDDVLHYGQKVKLVVNPAATDGSNWNVEKCFVRSFAVSQTHFAKYSRRGEVVASGNDSYECVFEVLTPDPTKRLVSEGVPVMAGAPSPAVPFRSRPGRCAAWSDARKACMRSRPTPHATCSTSQ